MVNITFDVGDKTYSFNATINLKFEKQDSPVPIRVFTLVEEVIKDYKRENKIVGVVSNVRVEDSEYICTAKDLKDLGVININKK